MKPRLTDFTDEQLTLAWNFMRRPETWPSDMAAALDDDKRLGLFLHFAVEFLRERARQLSAPVPAPPQAPRTAAPRAPIRPAAPRFDARRAAANDLND